MMTILPTSVRIFKVRPARAGRQLSPQIAGSTVILMMLGLLLLVVLVSEIL